MPVSGLVAAGAELVLRPVPGHPPANVADLSADGLRVGIKCEPHGIAERAVVFGADGAFELVPCGFEQQQVVAPLLQASEFFGGGH